MADGVKGARSAVGEGLGREGEVYKTAVAVLAHQADGPLFPKLTDVIEMNILEKSIRRLRKFMQIKEKIC
jgi:hypothetical protein